jgi:alpha-tubulin suppressor-like RCC1 family protein
MKKHSAVLSPRLLVAAVLTMAPIISGHSAGKVAAWGENDLGQCLLPNRLSNVKAIAAGTQHGLALRADGTVVGWGYNAQGQASPPPGLSGVIAIAAGGGHSLALRADGMLVPWGNNGNGLTNFPSGLNGSVRAIATGGSHSLALKTDGTVVAWGWNLYGQTNVPVGLSNVIAVAAASYHNLTLKADGTVAAWGQNSFGESAVPVSLSNVVAISAGTYHNLALKADGTVSAWGYNYGGRTNVPAGLSNVIAIAAGYYQSLALKSDGTVVSWGERTNVPAGLSNVTAIAIGERHLMAIVPDGPPEILGQPANLGIAYQSNIVLSVTATGYQPLSYRWLFNGSAFADTLRVYGALTPSLTIANAQFSDIGKYSVIVSNAFGVVPSTGAVLTVISPPIFTQHPLGRTVIAGTNLTLVGAAIGTPSLGYQWLFNGTPIPGAISTSLTLSNIQSTHSGSYSLVASNAYGTNESLAALVTVLESAPYILKQPTNTWALVGGAAVFRVDARGSIPMAYQWRFNGADIPGATSPTLSLSSLGYDAAGLYSVAISNAIGTTVSAKVELAVRQIVVWGSSFSNPFGSTNIPPAATNLVTISAGYNFLLGLKPDGNVAVFTGYPSLVSPPTNIPSGLNSVAAIAAGESHCLALRSNGTVSAWAAVSKYSYPFPRTPYDPVGFATNVPAGLSNVIAVAGGATHSLALKSDGKVVAWGVYPTNYFSLPWGIFISATNVPASATNVIAIAAGGNQNLALKADGRVVAWGGITNVPNGLSNVIAVACAEGLNLALQTNGKVVAWGGFPSWYPMPPRSSSATNVPFNLSNVVAIAAGDNGMVALALKADGTVTSWGSNPSPFPPSNGLSNLFAIAVGETFMCGLIGDGAPRMTIQPASHAVSKGATVRLSARAVSIQPISYQWQRDNVNLAGAASPDLIITNVSGTDTGGYRLIATNPRGNVTSAIATVTIPFSTNLAAALNATNLPWTTSTNAPAWFAQIHETHDGDVAAQSGHIGNNQQSLLQASVIGPGTLTFWWKVSSEQGFDRLWFNMDYQNWATWISGETGWQQFTFAVPAGAHTLNWAYMKDGTVTSGRDAGWLDEVTFTPAAPFALSAPQHLADGSFAFWSVDSGGRQLQPWNLSHIEIQASTNLRDWVVSPGVCTLTNGSLWIRDPGCTNFPQRFYRVIER